MNETRQIIINWLNNYCKTWFFCTWEQTSEPLKKRALQALASFLMS